MNKCKIQNFKEQTDMQATGRHLEVYNCTPIDTDVDRYLLCEACQLISYWETNQRGRGMWSQITDACSASPVVVLSLNEKVICEESFKTSPWLTVLMWSANGPAINVFFLLFCQRLLKGFGVKAWGNKIKRWLSNFCLAFFKRHSPPAPVTMRSLIGQFR